MTNVYFVYIYRSILGRQWEPSHLQQQQHRALYPHWQCPRWLRWIGPPLGFFPGTLKVILLIDFNSEV